MLMSGSLPPEAWAAALAGLPNMGPARLLALVLRWPPPVAWARVRDGSWAKEPSLVTAMGSAWERTGERWAAATARLDVEERWRVHCAAGVGIAAIGSAAYPSALASDIEPPGVLFWRGDPAVISGPRVAIVGTRAATRYGIDVAFELGRDLAAAGVAVVSGLALGIDGAAHSGALAGEVAPPIAVVGSGLDVIYPPAHGPLWREVARRGVVLTESPLGARPSRWRFPARNRLIAGLADALIVVESRARGGSMHTVDEAIRRGRTVYAVPGPVRSEASTGTNRLLGEGALPVCDSSDVLVGLGLTSALRRSTTEHRPAPHADDVPVLDALGWQPASVDQLALRTGLDVGRLVVALARLSGDGWVCDREGWYERVARSEPCG
jgi:DNA processing protein